MLCSNLHASIHAGNFDQTACGARQWNAFVRAKSHRLTMSLQTDHLSRVYYELTIWAPSWLDSLVGRALYQHSFIVFHSEVMGSNPVQAWIFFLFFRLSFRSCVSCVVTAIFFLFFRLSFRSCVSCVVTARIFPLFDLSSAVQIYVSYIYIHLFILHGYITNSQYDQLPVGLIAQLVEHCTGIAEVMGSNPVQAWIFFFSGFLFAAA